MRNARPIESSHLIRDGLPTGSPAPGFCLPRPDGSELSLEDYQGRRVLLVFSDPDCEPCNQLAPRLEQLHRRETDVQILMVSRGHPEVNRAKVAEHGLTFPVVLQRHWELSRKYGMFATPIAYLIGEQGSIASDVAVGGDAILALVTGGKHTMKRHIHTRLDELRKELERGQVHLVHIDRQRTSLNETMLRISGAIQVLEELLADSQPTTQTADILGNAAPVTNESNEATVQ